MHSLSRWSEKWLLRLNPEKCKVMHIRHSHKTSYTIRQDEKDWSLQEITEEKDLGDIHNHSKLKSITAVLRSSI